MSKKCCGIIYNEDEKFCTKCGKKLVDIEENQQLSQEAEVKEEAAKAEEPIKISEEEAQKKLDAMNLPIMNIEEIDKLTADIMGNTKKDKAETDKDTNSDELISNIEESNIEKDKEAETEAVTEEAKTEGTGNVESEKKNAKEVFDEDDDEDEEDENKASVGLKIFGFLSLLVMFAAIGVVVLGLIFVMFNPFYKKYDAGQIVIYPEIGTDTDGVDQNMYPLLPGIVLDKEEVATQTSAQGNVSEATPSDATRTDAEDDIEETETSEE